MMNLFDKVKVVCALVVMGLGLAAYSAAPTVTSVTAQQRYPWNGLVDIAVTFNGAESDVAKANCTFAATNSATKTALAITHVAQQGNDTGSGTTWTRRFIWDTNADLGEVKIDDVELFADVETVVEEPEDLGGVQLWEGGPYWAECNVGASKPEAYGLYFGWGDTVGHAGDWYFDEDHCPTLGKSESELYSLGYIDLTGNLAPAHDAARVHLGAPWRMPTAAELYALRNNCDGQWTTRNGVNGRLVRGRGAYASRSIFLPAAGVGIGSYLDYLGSFGVYWSSTPFSNDSNYAGDMNFLSSNFGGSYNCRKLGESVRPVRGFVSSSHVAYSTHLALDNRTGMRVANATERICFSPAWETDAMGATAVVSTNGVVVKSATEAGVYEWTPTQDGIYQLTHAVYVNGEQVGETLTATFLDEGYRRTVNCSFLVQQGEPQDEFDVTKAFAVLYKKVNGQYVEISRSGRQSQTFTVGDGTYRIEFQYADDTWVAANYSTELTVSQDSPGWAIEVEGRYIKAADTWSLWVQLYANEGDDLPYADLRYRGDARKWDEISSMSFDPNIDIPLSDLVWPHWALQSEEEVEWYEYDVINRKAGSRMPVGRVAGRRCITVWEKDVPYNMLRLVAKKKKVKKTVEIKFYKWEWKLFSFWAFAPEGTTTGAYVSPAIRDGERTEESFTVEDCEGISFVWKTSCEDAAAEGPQGDHGEFLVDGKVVATRAGESDWIRVSIDFEDTGSHTITWRYVKDASGSSGDDCMWVSCINVEPIAAENPELAIETEQLPSVMEMEEYEEQLECSGGTEPYWWSMDETDYLAVAEESTFAEVGEAQGWRKDDGEWVYDLPFAFNFGGRVYDSVVVQDNACLYFVAGSNTDAIETNLGDLYSESADQDIFVERAADHVTFRWKRVLYSDRESDVNCSITLNADGTIRCSFGDSSYYSRQVWLSTARDGAEAEQSGDDDIVFVPNYLPFGLWLDEETGVIYGAPEQSGHYAFNVYVSDDEGTINSKRMTLDVEANPNLRPVVEDWDHVDGRLVLRGGESRTFSVSVSDPEGEALTYRWYYDGHVVQGATGPSFVLQTDVDMRGWHSLICEASDGLWFVDAGTWSFAIGGEQFVTFEDGADALQVAVDNAVDGDVIYVGPGTYSSIEVPWCERVRIVATDGCANTIIDGGRTASCVSVAYAGGETNRMVRIEGFTLQDGCADMGGGARYAWLVGCVVLGNVADNYGGGLCYGRADNCLIVGNSAQYGGGACWAALYNCTVVGNAAYTYGGGINSCGDIANTIVWGNYQDDELEWFTTVNGDPLFVDSENLDFRLAEGSPCIGMGDNSLVATARDLAGNVRIQGGSVDLGAYESAYALPRPQDSTGLWVSPRTDMIRLEWSDVTYAKFYKVYRVKDELDDSQAKLIGTTDQLWFDDRSAWHDVTYRYWVVACNEMGDGPVGDYAWGALLDPLEIVDSELPAGVVGKPYEHTLEARGGDESYEWRVLAFSPDVEKNSGVPQAGVPMGWVEDDGCWSYELPFEFPVGTGGTKEVEVSDNGYLTLSDGDEYVTLYAAYDVDLYADPGDVYVTVGQDSVTFRWERVIYGTDGAVNVSATLYADGSVRLGDYDNSSDVVFRGYETGRDDACLDVSGDIILRPNALPRGLELGEDGTLSGVPQKDGVFQFVVAVIDGNREYGFMEFSLHVTGEAIDPIPDLGSNPTVGEVREALEGSADDRLQANITDGENYNAYRAWATTVRNENGSGLAGAQAVRMSPYAWVSFATDSAALLAKMPTDEDLKVEEFKPSAAAGSFDFTVSVKDVTIGDKASVDNLKKLFGLEGAESLDTAAFSSENVSLDFREPQDGKLKFTATPAVDNAKSFFMKVKVK